VAPVLPVTVPMLFFNCLCLLAHAMRLSLFTVDTLYLLEYLLTYFYTYCTQYCVGEQWRI